MRKSMLLIFVSLCAGICLAAQDAKMNDTSLIKQVLAKQVNAWNGGDIDAFMDGYWHNDSLMFVNQQGITYGWQQTLTNYKKRYDSPEKMGRLNFDILEVNPLGDSYYFVIGK